MYHRLIPSAALVAAASVTILLAQAPSPPTHLRVVPSNWNPTDTKGPAHEYFDKLIARPEHFVSYSLRNQAQADALTSDGIASTTWTYDPANDTYPDKQDALKFTKINPPVGAPGHGKGSVPQDDILNLNRPSWNLGPENESVIIIWDQYWGPEFRDNCGEVTHLKSVGIQNNGKGWWTFMQSPGPARNADDKHTVAMRTDIFTTGQPLPEGLVRNDQIVPSGKGTFLQWPGYQTAGRQYESKWSRFILEIKPGRPPSDFTEWNEEYGVKVTANPNHAGGAWHMVSTWILDEDHEAQRLLYRVPMGFGVAGVPVISGMRFTMDSSKDGFLGPWFGYIRNVVVLRNYSLPAVTPESDKFIFQRPVRG